MKLSCDLCGSTLQMNLGGQGATCTCCGLTYPMERLKEMLTGKPAEKEDPPKDIPEIPAQKKEKEEKKPLAPEARQFIMPVSDFGTDYLSGQVQQGGIGVGCYIYINHDYAHPYKITCLNAPTQADAKEGMWTQLYLKKCPQRILKNATVVTGDPDPVVNAYNYLGTVKEYFSHVFSYAFPEYTIEENASQEGLEIPVAYRFSKEGKPVLAVFLLGSKDKEAGRQVKKAALVLVQQGIPCTHFYDNYRNDMPYVIQRVRDALAETAPCGTPSRKEVSGAGSEANQEPEAIILEVRSIKKRLGFAWGNAICFIRQGCVQSGMPYYAHINTPDGEEIQLGSLKSSDAAEGSEVKMLLYCDKSRLAGIQTLYLSPGSAWDEADDT